MAPNGLPRHCCWCGRLFTATRRTRRRQTCGRRECVSQLSALKRSDASRRQAGKKGGRRSGQVRRRAALKAFLNLVHGPLRPFGTALYLLGFMHGQNTAAIRFRKAHQGRGPRT